MYGPQGAETFIANSGCVIGLGANDPGTTEWESNFSGRHWVTSISVSDDPQTGQPRINIGMKYKGFGRPITFGIYLSGTA